MSVPHAENAKEIRHKVKLEQKKRFEMDIDADVQLLKERAENLVKSVEPDTQNYWAFKVKLSEIKYENPDIVIKQFVDYMKILGYAIPSPFFQKNWWKPNSFYVIRFRPDDE